MIFYIYDILNVLREMEMDINYYTQIFKVLSHPVRLKIAYGLLHKENCNVLVMAEKLGLKQPVVSQHLAIMKKAKILDNRRDGVKICYFLADENVKKIISSIGDDLCK